MNVSIIIPTKNRTQILEETVSVIFNNQAYPHDQFEVIIVNDGTGQIDYLQQKFANVKIVKNSKPGAASARNTGVNISSNELLLFIDDDMLIAPDCIQRHIELHQKYARTIVSGSWEYDDKMLAILNSSPFGRYKLQYDYKSLEAEEKNILENGIYTCRLLASFNLSILRKDFIELGGFDITFPYAGCEDQELTMRAKEKGFELLLDQNNKSIHNEHDRADMEKWLTRQYTGMQGYILLFDLFPYRKQQALYIENGIIRKGDSLKVILKKSMKYLMALPPGLWTIKTFIYIFEKLNVPDKILFRLYNGLCGLSIYKGIRYAEIHLMKKFA